MKSLVEREVTVRSQDILGIVPIPEFYASHKCKFIKTTCIFSCQSNNIVLYANVVEVCQLKTSYSNEMYANVMYANELDSNINYESENRK